MAAMVSAVVTVVLLALFLAGWAWAWSSRRAPTFTAAARMPLEDEWESPQPGRSTHGGGR